MQSLCSMRVPGIAPRQATLVARPSCPTLSPAASHAPFGISSDSHARQQRSVASGSTSTLVRAETKEQQHEGAASSPPAVAVATAPHTVPAAAPAAPKEKEHWWEKDLAPNMRDAHSVQELVDLLADAGDRLVIVEFYARWCAACRALFPKICRLMGDNPELLFIKVDFDVNKPMARTLGIKVLPFFHFYKGGEGRVEAFSCTITKLQRFKDAVEKHSGAFCSLQPLTGLAEFPDVVPHGPYPVSDGESNNNSRPDTPTRVA